MKHPSYVLKERIGDPSLFCGRKKELELLMNWTSQIPRKFAESRALGGKSDLIFFPQNLF